MSNKTNMNGETYEVDCSEIQQGDFVRKDAGDTHIVTGVDKEHQQVDAVNLGNGAIRSFDRHSDGDDGVLVLEKVDRGSVTVDVQPDTSKSTQSAANAISDFKPGRSF